MGKFFTFNWYFNFLNKMLEKYSLLAIAIILGFYGAIGALLAIYITSFTGGIEGDSLLPALGFIPTIVLSIITFNKLKFYN